MTPEKQLIDAIREDDVDLVNSLIAQGANVNAKQNAVPLIMYITDSEKSVEIARLFISAGANINAVSYINTNALHMATRLCNISLMELLLEEGISPNQESKQGRTPFLDLCEYCDLDKLKIREAIDILIKYGADIHTKDKRQKGAMHLSYSSDNYKVMLALLKYNIDQTVEKVPVLFKMTSNTTEFKQMVNEGMNIDQTTRFGNLLFQTILDNKIGLTRFLIKKGIDVNHQNEDGETPLILSAKFKNKNQPISIWSLLDAGADITIEDDKGKTVLDYLDGPLKCLVEKKILEQEVDNEETVSLGL